MEKIAICIVTHNRKNDLLLALDSVFNQSYSNFDVFIWDNCSTDGTETAIKSKYPTINYCYSDKNLGGAGGYASLLRLCFERDYNFFWCLDDDATLTHNCLEIMVDAFMKLNENCIIGPKIISDINNPVDFWPLQGEYNPETKKIRQFSPEEIDEIKTYKKNIYPTVSVALLGLFTNRAVLAKVNFPKENLFVSSDDVEFCLRAWKNQIPVYKVANALIIHPPLITKKISFFFKKVDVILMSDFKLFYFIRNNVYIAKKYFTKCDFMKHMGALLLTTIVNSIYSSKKPLRTFFLGVKSLFIGLKFR